MAGDKVNNYSQVDSDILALQLTTDKTFKGYHQLTLTNYDNTTVPAIAAGSAIECNGALYKFDTEEAISTTDPVTSAAVADGTVYICIIPSTDTCTAAFTATAPTWSDSKQGWYGTGDQANYRYAQYCMLKASTSYSGKTRMFRYKNDTFYIASDATERTVTNTSRVNDTNLTITVPIVEGRLYEIYLSGEFKSVSDNGYIYIRSSSDSYLEYVNNSLTPVDTYYFHAFATQPACITNSGSGYYQYHNKQLFLSNATTSYTYYMSWSIVSGTVYAQNRKVMIREVGDVFMGFNL